MRFLVVGGSEALPLAERLAADGAEVRMFTDALDTREVERSQSWRSDVRWANIVIPLGGVGSTRPARTVALDLGRLVWPDEDLEPPLPESGVPTWLIAWNGLELIGPTWRVHWLDRLLNDDLGPQVPPMGLALVREREGTFRQQEARKALKEVSPGLLLVSPYEGGLRFARPNTEILYTLLESLNVDLPSFISGLVVGGSANLPGHAESIGPVAVGIRAYCPPWPYSDVSAPPVSISVAEGAEKHVWSFGDQAWATAYGRDPREATRRLRKVVSGLDAPGLMYRTDSFPALTKMCKEQ